MVATAKNFEVCSAGEGCANPDNQLTGSRAGNGYVFNANVLAAVEDGGLHGCLAQLARRFNGIAANLDDLFYSASANVENFLNCVPADLKHIANGTAANLQDILNGRTTAFYGVCHRVLLERRRECRLAGSLRKLPRSRGLKHLMMDPAKRRQSNCGNGSI
jgi:hypothetical protein